MFIHFKTVASFSFQLPVRGLLEAGRTEGIPTALGLPRIPQTFLGLGMLPPTSGCTLGTLQGSPLTSRALPDGV